MMEDNTFKSLMGTDLKFVKVVPMGVNRGFTLIELVVVMLLIALASSLVLMNVGQSGRMKQDRIFVEKLMGLCKGARTTAMARGIPVCMTILPERRLCLIAPMGGLSDGGAGEDGNGEVGIHDPWDGDGASGGSIAGPWGSGSLAIPETVRIEGERIRSDEDGGHHICFYGDGSASGGILTLSVEDRFDLSFQVDTLTGAVRPVRSQADGSGF